MTMLAPAPAAFLDEVLLGRFAERVADADRENRFCAEDIEELKASGYLAMCVPAELGGGGADMVRFCREQRRLGAAAPATALAVNMHLYWTGVAADLWRSGDTSLEWLLRETVDGEIFAAGHAESGNDIPILLATTVAEPVEGGYRFTGRKSFGSLSPVWTRFGLHGLDTSDPTAPRVVHGFMPRETDGYRIEPTWDTLGMRPTESNDTVLDGAFVPDRYIGRVVPAGAAGADLFVVGIFAWALLGFANIYYGLAQRVLDETLERVHQKRAMALTRSMAHHPEVQHAVAEMILTLDAIEPHITLVAQEWADGVDHGARWPSRLFSAKHHAVEGSWRVVDTALDVAGGFGIFRRGGLERMFRDARLGRIHPANSFLTHEVVAKTALGIDLDDPRRWG